MNVVSRQEWGARNPKRRVRMDGEALSVTAHHSFAPALPASATPEQERAAMRAMQMFHMDVQGWSDIGYGHAVFQSGRVYEARGWGIVGAHAGTNEGNRTSHGVVFVIDGNVDAPSPAALASFYELRREGECDRHLRLGHALKLHRDWKDTDCPGDVAARVLRERNGNDTPPKPAPRLLEEGSRGEDVRALQKKLGMAARYHTGNFGPLTANAVKLFQWQNGLVVDGKVGPKTRAALGL